MKFNDTFIWAIAASLLLSIPAWAEDTTSVGEQSGHEAEHQSSHVMSNTNEMEQIGDAGTVVEDKAMDDSIHAEQSGFSRGSVVRSVFTSSIEDREPTDSIKELNTNSDKVIYYTELRDMAGQTARHRWEFNGEVMAEVEFNVGGSRWRVWSSKSFVPGWTGEWKVSVLNGANEVISEDLLSYTASVAEPVIDESAPTEVMQVQ